MLSRPAQEQPAGRGQPVRPSQPKYCLGLLGRACQFGTQGAAARLHGGQKCLFSDVTKLNQSFLEGPSSLALRKRYNRLTPEAQRLVLTRMEDPGYRHWLQQHGRTRTADEEAPVRAPSTPEQSSWKSAHPFSPEELTDKYSVARTLWSSAVTSRLDHVMTQHILVSTVCKLNPINP